MASLRLRLIRGSIILAVLFASCASAPKVLPDYSRVPDPAAADYIRAEALGVPLRAFTQGHASADILVLYIHGWAASGAEGLAMGEALGREASSAPSVWFVSPDLPGSGASGKPEAPYTPEWFVDVLDAFRESLGRDRVVLAGHSLGGRLALEYALRYPEHTEALILLAPAGLSDSFRSVDRWAMSRDGLVRAGANLVSGRQYLRLYERRVVRDPRHAYPRIAQWAIDGLLTPEGKTAFRAVTRNALAAPDLTDRLPEIKAPVLLIWGKDDQVLKFDSADIFLAGLPDVRGFLALDDCGHLPQTERSEETARAAYSFLASLTSSCAE